MAKREFQTEVNQLLHLIVHSLYSHPEIFLRELISNASDALDKLRHLTLVDDAYKAVSFSPRIDLELDEEKKTLTIADTGIGMNEEELVSNLGTIARSGTKNFLAQLSGDAQEGFEPDRPVRGGVLQCVHGGGSRRGGFAQGQRSQGVALGQRWQDGVRDRTGGARTARAQRCCCTSTRKARSTPIAGGCRRLSRSIPTTSRFPIFLTYDKSEWDEKEKKSTKKRVTEQVNAASALWRRPKSELKDEDYKELYKSIAGGWDDPLFWFHTKAEGSLEYTTLFYVPSKAPLDLYQADYKGGVKLYVKRVFIMDDSKELLPQYLRFIRGIIDSEDLPLNVSREILQQNRVVTSIRTASVKKILSELKNIAEKQPEQYRKFIEEYNRPLKEGLYGDFGNRETLLDLIRFKSTKAEGLTSLGGSEIADERGPEGIYYITGGNGVAAAHFALARNLQEEGHRGADP